ncbi:MAG: hypothetical protein ACK40V_11425, partial [Anaerolineales bacterium]
YKSIIYFVSIKFGQGNPAPTCKQKRLKQNKCSGRRNKPERSLMRESCHKKSRKQINVFGA